MSETPYTVKPNRINRILSILLFFSTILLFYFFEVGEFWNSLNWFLRTVLIAFYSLYILLTVGLFIKKTDFTDEFIFYRNLFGITKIKKYKDIVKVSGEEGNISIKFSDESLIIVWVSEGNIHKVLRIIKKKRES